MFSFSFYCFPLFLCIDCWGRLSYLSLLFFGTLHSDAYIFPFLLCLSLLSFSQLFVRPGEYIIQCPIFLPFYTVHGVLKARILKWFAIPFSSLRSLSTLNRYFWCEILIKFQFSPYGYSDVPVSFTEVFSSIKDLSNTSVIL